jgi:hypothetical protein
MFVCCVCWGLSGRSLCDELITRPDESYRMWRVVLCDEGTSWYEEAIARVGLQNQRKLTTYKAVTRSAEPSELSQQAGRG